MPQHNLAPSCEASYSCGEKSIRPWGTWEILLVRPQYVVKHITVLVGQRLSLQRHQHRSETWVILRGTAELTIDACRSRLSAGDAVTIPQGTWHRIYNCGTEPLEFIETQTGSLLCESDIERKEDDFGRA